MFRGHLSDKVEKRNNKTTGHSSYYPGRLYTVFYNSVKKLFKNLTCTGWAKHIRDKAKMLRYGKHHQNVPLSKQGWTAAGLNYILSVQITSCYGHQ